MSAPRVIIALVSATVVAGFLVARLGMPAGPGAHLVTSPPAPSPQAARGGGRESSPGVPEDYREGDTTPQPPARPTLALEPRAAPPGTRIKLSGSGFPPLGQVTAALVSAGQGGERQLGSLSTAADGQFGGTLTLPVDLAPGRYSLRARDATGEGGETGLWVVPEEGRLDLRSYAAHPGEALDLTGAGFAPGEAVRLYLADSPSPSLATLTADAQGGVAASAVKVPDLPAGIHTLVAEGEQTGVAVRREFGVVDYTPWVVLSTYALRPGGAVDVSGHDFAPGEEVQVYLDDASSPTLALKSGADGTVSVRAAFAARPEDVGKHRVVLAGASTRTQASATLEVLAYVPKLALTSWAGPPGAGVAFTGEGFAPGETVRVYLEQASSREQVAAFPAGADGAFQGAGAYAVPGEAATGKLRFVAVGDQSRVPVSQDFAVQAPSAWAELSAYSGPAGAPPSFRGKGFAPGEHVEAHLGAANGPVVGSATADRQGSFDWAGPLALPAGQVGPIRLYVVGAASRTSAEAEYDAVAASAAAGR